MTKDQVVVEAVVDEIMTDIGIKEQTVSWNPTFNTARDDYKDYIEARKELWMTGKVRNKAV